MAKKTDYNVITEKDIVFTIIFERYCGYCGKGGKAKHDLSAMRKYARSNFADIKCVRGHSPKMTEWEPITQSDNGESHIKYVAQCDYAGVKKFLYNSSLYYDCESMGIIDEDGHKMADAWLSDIQVGYSTAFDEKYFKRFGELGDQMYQWQNTSRENASIGVEIPYERLEKALISSFRKPLEKIKDEKKLQVIQQNFDKLEKAYRVVLDWLKNDIDSNKPMPTFSVDFREQDLFM